MPLSDYDKKNVKAIVENERADWFTAELMRLIARSDAYTRGRFRRRFPEEVALVERAFGLTNELNQALLYVFGKGDYINAARLRECFPDEFTAAEAGLWPQKEQYNG